MTPSVVPSDTWQVELTLAEAGAGRTALVLHGEGGPATVAPIADRLADSMRTVTPTHPGWDGTARPPWFARIDDIALAYLFLLQEQRLNDVLVIGSSLGGWIGAEMAVRDADAGRISALVLVDSVGVDVQGELIRDYFALDPRAIADFVFHDSSRVYDPATLPYLQAAAWRANLDATRVYAANPYMHDPKLLRRLGLLTLPVQVIWGDRDQIVTPAYGRAMASALNNSEFTEIKNAGHLPQVEQPEQTFAAIEDFLVATGR